MTSVLTLSENSVLSTRDQAVGTRRPDKLSGSPDALKWLLLPLLPSLSSTSGDKRPG